MSFEYKWTDGNDELFGHFYRITEDYYSSLVGGEDKRKPFIPYNMSSCVENVLIVFDEASGCAVACSGLKRYSDSDVEIKRVWVEQDHRGRHIATEMMRLLETKARETGYRRMILQTRESMTDAVALYIGLGYKRIANYPPYDKMDGAICLAKEL